MALVLKEIYNSYQYYFYTAQDSRSKDWFLIQTPPLSICLVLIGYVAMVKQGPNFMEKRQPFELKFIMMIYNLFQVVTNLFMCLYGGYFFFIKTGFDFRCQSINYSSDETGMTELTMCYCYFLLKILDLLDTLFIILRKKNAHLSFLHCYHHFFMVFGTNIAIRWVPGGHPLLLGFMNLFIHAVMYSYYFFTAVKPELKQSMWWKKHITQLQMIQFAVLVVAFIIPCFSKNCGYPKFWLWVLVTQNTFMFSLFADFYRKAYFSKPEIHKVE